MRGHGRVPSKKGTVMTEEFMKFIDRYVEAWNEPDAEQRRRTIEALWVPGGANYTPSTEATGYQALDDRVTSAYNAYVRSGKYRFRRAGPPVAHHNAVKVQWEMVTVDDDSVASVGLEFLILADDGRIISDHQFIVS
jgi:hypothetical protein